MPMLAAIPAAYVAAASVAATVAATAVSVIGQMQAAKAQQNQATAANNVALAKAQQDRNNATLAGRAAADALVRGDTLAAGKQNQTNLLIGQQRVALAANGVDANSGSALDLQSDTGGLGEFDQLSIHSNALREASGYTAQGMNYSTQASVDEASANNIASDGSLKAAASIIGGAGSVASTWYDYKFGTRQRTVA